MNTIIRKARPDELAIVQDLNFGAFENDVAHDPYLIMDWPHNPSAGRAYFQSRIEGNGICLIAEHDGEVIGYLAGAMRKNEAYRHGSRSELENMFVKPSERRRYVGTALIDAFKAWSRTQGADELYVSAYFDNERAVSFYQNNGFISYSHDLLLDLRQTD